MLKHVPSIEINSNSNQVKKKRYDEGKMSLEEIEISLSATQKKTELS